MEKPKAQKTNIASLLYLKKDNKVLLMRRIKDPFRGLYTFVSGKVDDGENFTDAMVRETKEEANIDLSREGLEVKHIMHQYDQGDEWVHTFFVAEKWKGEIQNMEPEKCDDLDWFDLNNLPENTVYLVTLAIENIERGIFYSEFSRDKNDYGKNNSKFV